eukprot:6194389-Pleurochrysis_carterae.AAC.3
MCAHQQPTRANTPSRSSASQPLSCQHKRINCTTNDQLRRIERAGRRTLVSDQRRVLLEVCGGERGAQIGEEEYRTQQAPSRLTFGSNSCRATRRRSAADAGADDPHPRDASRPARGRDAAP